MSSSLVSAVPQLDQKYSTAVEKHQLSNGAIVLLDPDSRFNSSACAVSLLGGSRSEAAEESGLTHLLEHLLFKRTAKRGRAEIAAKIDELGGDLNAYTDTDSLCLHTVVPASRLGAAMDFISELLLESRIDEADLAIEKEIVRQEILENEDNPADLVSLRFEQLMWPDSPLGLPVYGSVSSLERFGAAELRARLESLRSGRRLVIAVAGGFDKEAVLAHCNAAYGALPPGEALRREEPRRGSGFEAIEHPSGQVYFMLGTYWPGMNSLDYVPGVVLATILGDSSSSRLFQSLREDHGLAYDICAGIEGYPDVGCFRISGAVERRSLKRAVKIIDGELSELAKNGVSEEELRRAVLLLSAQLELQADSISSRFWRLIESEINVGRFVSNEELLGRLNSLTREDLGVVLERWIASGSYLQVIGGDVDGIEGPVFGPFT